MERGETSRALLPLVLVVAPLLLLACQNDRQAALERDLRDLQDEVRVLKRSRAEHRTRIDELSGKLLMLRDELESQSMMGRRRTRSMGDLPVVRVGAPPAAEGSLSIVETSEPVSKPAPAPRRAPEPRTARPRKRAGFSVERADRRGIDPGHRLTVEPLPPPPSKPAAAAAKPPKPSPPASTPSPAPRAPKPKAEAPLPDDTGPVPPPSGKPQEDYKTGYRLFQEGRYASARMVFARFLKTYPDHDLTDNSVYWTGETYFRQRRYPEAQEWFNRVIEAYPTGNKVPDAFLKIGLCYLHLGRKGAARKILDQVRSIFPETHAAKIALDHLRTLETR